MSEGEHGRRAALEAYGVLDTPPEESYDRLTALAAAIFDAPIALVSLVDADRQWFKSRYGLEASQTPRQWAFCDHAIASDAAVMVVEDAALDPRFQNNPLVTGAPFIRFYVGAVLVSPQGVRLGSICVIDTKPRPRPADSHLDQLRLLAGMVIEQMEQGQKRRQSAQIEGLLHLAEVMIGVGRWRFDLRSETMTWSDEVYRIHGFEPGSVDPTAPEVTTAYHPDDLSALIAAFASTVQTREGYNLQVRLMRRDGEWRDVVTRAGCELNDRGELTAVLGVFQDVTDHVRALAAARLSERNYRLMAENMADVVVCGGGGGAEYISPAVERLFGYTPEEMASLGPAGFVHPDDMPAVRQELADMFGENKPGCKTLRHRSVRKDGHVIWVEANFQRIGQADGHGPEMVVVIRDITDRHALEEELRAARAEAEAAAAAKGAFLANMSHELRTPLTAVLGFARLVENQPELSDVTLSYMRRVSEAGQALLYTVNDILDFSKLEAGQVQVHPQPVDVGPVALNALSMLGAQAGAKRLALEVGGFGDLPPLLMVDPDRLRQVLLNLIGNAVKFTDVGLVRLDCAYDAAAARLTFTISDTGIGMAPDQMGALFQRFSQVDGSRDRRHGGTGLGLAICKGLVEAMGGGISVRSQPGVGSVFTFHIAAPEAEVSAAGAAPPPQVGGSLAGRRILVVDDNSSNRELVRAILGPFGVEIVEAVDGLDAIDKASAPFDAILMDMRMPRLDGASAARRIRMGPGPNEATPIVAFSAELGGAAEAGLFDAFAAKPISPLGLVASIGDVLLMAEASGRCKAA